MKIPSGKEPLLSVGVMKIPSGKEPLKITNLILPSFFNILFLIHK